MTITFTKVFSGKERKAEIVSTNHATLPTYCIDNLQSLRAGSNNPPFNITLPQNNITSLACPHELAPGTYGPAVSDGFYVMLAPLSAGSHTLHFKGVAGGLIVDVTYHLTIQPGEEED